MSCFLHLSCHLCTSCCQWYKLKHSLGRGLQGGARNEADKAVPLSLEPGIYTRRLGALAALHAAWSPVCTLNGMFSLLGFVVVTGI